ncbi:carboxymuconolactone decarboxylase family protein [Duganella qianjiadongensis]|uniref:Carboxymuconolactone decarboxylase family protein n=1 Tax=Duganella qianjiadongensis TaxID=2692176 RepID=A0ABW9VPR5_9BURK|nr:carboxymuconolactone decarboxylase family protein [Duganella qianjiadongensis]MYM40717.1 carboxymuconolactone decarboxylase family protein [Duganella qianjiadongensis]
MSKRLDIFKLAAPPYQHLIAIKDYVSAALPAELLELVYLRVSQINHCAFCIDMHTRDLLKLEVSMEKISLLPVWDEAAPLFSAEERAALAWAESVTRVEHTRVPDAEYAHALSVLGEQTLADLTVAVTLMNAFNRFSVSMRRPPAALAALA